MRDSTSQKGGQGMTRHKTAVLLLCLAVLGLTALSSLSGLLAVLAAL